MKRVIREIFKKIVLKILPDSNRLRSIAHRPMLETWRKHYSANHPVFDTRFEMYDFINIEVINNKNIQYLEFGVYKGESIKYFADINTDPDSRFIGFDTFTGLPEDWTEFSRTVKSKTFDTGGEIPQSDDMRISFIKGMFQDTLPKFMKEYKTANQLVINSDSDIYSSTMFFLTYANDAIVPGTIILFDEFYSVMHEFRALEDYCSSYMRSYEVIAAARNHAQIAIRMR
jgi:hypothetical protein